MTASQGGEKSASPDPGSELDRVVEEVAREAHLDLEALRPEERQYLKEHSLRKPLGTRNIWALGVGAVITGEYFGWNGGLGVAGPIGMLLATLFVCVLYLTWTLSLTELSVAMPFAGGPLAYGRARRRALAGVRHGLVDVPRVALRRDRDRDRHRGLHLLHPGPDGRRRPQGADDDRGGPGHRARLRGLAVVGRGTAGEGDGLDDLRRDPRADLVLGRLPAGRPAGTPLHPAAADRRLGGGRQGDPLSPSGSSSSSRPSRWRPRRRTSRTGRSRAGWCWRR